MLYQALARVCSATGTYIPGTAEAASHDVAIITILPVRDYTLLCTWTGISNMSDMLASVAIVCVSVFLWTVAAQQTTPEPTANSQTPSPATPSPTPGTYTWVMRNIGGGIYVGASTALWRVQCTVNLNQLNNAASLDINVYGLCREPNYRFNFVTRPSQQIH